jgi:hypothetical protein
MPRISWLEERQSVSYSSAEAIGSTLMMHRMKNEGNQPIYRTRACGLVKEADSSSIRINWP